MQKFQAVSTRADTVFQLFYLTIIPEMFLEKGTAKKHL